MSDASVQASLRVIAELAGVRLEKVYRLMRLPSSPAPVGHPGCVPVYDVAVVLEYLRGSPRV